ncbi:MAG: 2-amino-4-hydroxy-6-hydroxymethyldihydropteridine diphosphokinase [Desulfobacterales bacterium]
MKSSSNSQFDRRNGPHTAIISIGSNLGDKLENCRRAIESLRSVVQTQLCACSRFYKTAPVDYLDQDWFVNAAVKITTRLKASQLLAALQEIQRRAGRRGDPVRFGPRIIDLDIIFFDAAVIETPELQVPHPRLHKRRFVLQPICDIDPAIVHPVLNQDVGMLLDQLKDDAQRVEPICCDC